MILHVVPTESLPMLLRVDRAMDRLLIGGSINTDRCPGDAHSDGQAEVAQPGVPERQRTNVHLVSSCLPGNSAGVIVTAPSACVLGRVVASWQVGFDVRLPADFDTASLWLPSAGYNCKGRRQSVNLSLMS